MRRKHTSQPLRARWGLVLLAAGLLACELDDGPRRAPYPILDPRGAFPELAEILRSRGPEPAAAYGHVREEGWPESICGGEPGGERELLVGGSLAVNLPDSAWKAIVGPQGDRRILRFEQGKQVVAWIYFEEARGGSASIARFRDFLSRVDRRLVEPLPFRDLMARAALTPVQDAGAPEPAATPAATSSGTDPSPPPPALPAVDGSLAAAGDTLKSAVAAVDDGLTAASRYLARNGYESLSGSFTGWRWLGRCRNDPTLPLLRLARTTGTWRQDGGADAAYMVVGSATLGRDVGVYLAVVALYPPANPQAAELAGILASFHAGHGAGDFQPGTDPSVFKEWAVAIGLEEEE